MRPINWVIPFGKASGNKTNVDGPYHGLQAELNLKTGFTSSMGSEELTIVTRLSQR